VKVELKCLSLFGQLVHSTAFHVSNDFLPREEGQYSIFESLPVDVDHFPVQLSEHRERKCVSGSLLYLQSSFRVQHRAGASSTIDDWRGWVPWLTLVIPATWEAGIWSEAKPRQETGDPIWKITKKQKVLGDVAQVVEHCLASAKPWVQTALLPFPIDEWINKSTRKKKTKSINRSFPFEIDAAFFCL
jgi:hypothetical protein